MHEEEEESVEANVDRFAVEEDPSGSFAQNGVGNCTKHEFYPRTVANADKFTEEKKDSEEEEEEEGVDNIEQESQVPKEPMTLWAATPESTPPSSPRHCHGQFQPVFWLPMPLWL